MGTAKQSEPTGHNDQPPASAGPQPADEPEKTETGETIDYSLPGEQEELHLPAEPPLAWQTPPEAGYDPDAALTELRDFFLHGQRPQETVPSGPKPVPALLYPHQDLTRTRYDYPACLDGSEPGGPARPLSEIIDELIANVADEKSDVGQRVKRHAYKLESEIKSQAELNPGSRLSVLWDRGVENIISSSELSTEKKNHLEEDLAAAKAGLSTDGEIISCGPDVPARLLSAAMNSYWEQKCGAWREEMDSLIEGLKGILDADFTRSPQSRSPEKLRSSSGATNDEMDFDTMSLLLSESNLGEAMPETRRERLQNTLAALRELRPLFAGGKPDAGAEPPFKTDIVAASCKEALAQHEARMQTMVELFKAAQIARLEINNGYKEDKHDKLFESYGVDQLTDEELALCPPVILSLNADGLTHKDNQALLEILGAGLPIKILLQIDDLLTGGGISRAPSVRPGWQARLSSMVMALGSAYVFQSPVSNLSYLQSGLRDGLAFQGPALFSVYTGSARGNSSLGVYFHAAAAVESRAFPVFKFDPGKGQTQAERIDVSDNPQSEAAWPVDTFSYRTAGGEKADVQLPFTFADFLACDQRLDGSFWIVPAEKWHKEMAPLGEYLQDASGESRGKIPYVTMVDAGNHVCRVAVNREILAFVEQIQSYWRTVQELGGINNSFALKLLAEEKQKLEEGKQREIEEIEKKYTVELDREIGGLTQEIVQRIAGQLMAQGTGGFGPLPAISAAPAATAGGAPSAAEPAPATEEPVEEAVEEEEEALSFDDPYIDTPLCTSCNECTNLNGMMFNYNENKQAFIADPGAGTFKELVMAAEKCPVHIIHPGKPNNPSEPELDELIKRAAPFN